MKAAAEKFEFMMDRADRIKHVIYIIKENRTYDQIFGDLEQDGKPVGNGDPSLTMYGEDITPNLHKLALQFGVLDNFYDSGEVSGDGHVWSNAAIGTDYLEKTWQQAYRGNQRTYDFEGVVAEGYPLLQKIPDVNEPASGYSGATSPRMARRYYHFGEYISSVFCDEVKTGRIRSRGRCWPGKACSRARRLRRVSRSGGVGRRREQVAMGDSADCVEHGDQAGTGGPFRAGGAGLQLAVPDQIRVEIFLRHLKQWVADKQQGKDTMPNFILLRLPDDHTAGTRPANRRRKLPSPITISPWAARSKRFRTRRSGMTPRSSSSKTMRRTVPTTWMRTAASRW